MTDAAADRAFPAQGIDLIGGLRALRALLRDKEDTTRVFEIMRAMNAGAARRGYGRLLSTPRGGAIAFAREELAPLLDDDAYMSRFAPGSVGATYLAWRRAENLSAAGLAEAAGKGLRQGPDPIPHPWAWFGRRTRDVHDLWHILTGYGRDGLGEACLVAFSFAQTGGPGWALIAAGAAVQALAHGQTRALAAILEGWRRGRRSAWLLGEDYHQVLAEPVEAARARLRIPPAKAYDAAVARAAEAALAAA